MTKGDEKSKNPGLSKSFKKKVFVYVCRFDFQNMHILVIFPRFYQKKSPNESFLMQNKLLNLKKITFFSNFKNISNHH
jgi:hypothetical protein